MANVWAIKSGDWSDPTVWNTGVLPTSLDDVYANTFNVNVNQTITVVSLKNTSNTGITAGGIFTFNTDGITATITATLNNSASLISVTAPSGIITLNVNQQIISNTTNIVHTGNCNLIINTPKISSINTSGNVTSINKTSLGLLTINADIQGNLGAFNYGGAAVILNSNSDTVINGNIFGSNTNSTSGPTILVSLGNLHINGNVNSNVAGNNSGFGTISCDSSGTITVLGNIVGGTAVAVLMRNGNLTLTGDLTGATSSYSVVLFQSSGNANITGKVEGNLFKALLATNGSVTITGNILGTKVNGVPSVDIQGTATLNHIGTAQASAFSSAIACNTPTQSTVTCTGPFLKNGNVVAIASQTLRINFNSNSYFQFKKSNGEDIDYVSTIEGYNYPTASDVRDGVVYKSGLVTGTLKVPNPADVRKSIPTDNTVGTADITPEDFITALENSTSDIAVRLRNCATVESTGAQIASYE